VPLLVRTHLHRPHRPLQPQVPTRQCLSTVPQHQWISKIFGYDFIVEYRLGKLNTAADALSRRDTELLGDGPPDDNVRAAACALSALRAVIHPHRRHSDRHQGSPGRATPLSTPSGGHAHWPMAPGGRAAAARSPNFRTGPQRLAPPGATISSLSGPRGHPEDASPPTLRLLHPRRSRTGPGLGPVLRHMSAEQDADPPAGGTTLAPRRAVPSLGRHLHRLHRGTPEGGREVHHPHSGRSLLQVSPLHRARPSLHRSISRTCLLRRHRVATRVPLFHRQRQGPCVHRTCVARPLQDGGRHAAHEHNIPPPD
jgi:hypothetical protein